MKAIKPIDYNDVVIGQVKTLLKQYTKNNDLPGYTEDPTVPVDSKTPTFCSLLLYINNMRWSGVPIYITSGKGLNERKAEIKVCFKWMTGGPFGDMEK